jgi:hypothetical protein
MVSRGKFLYCGKVPFQTLAARWQHRLSLDVLGEDDYKSQFKTSGVTRPAVGSSTYQRLCLSGCESICCLFFFLNKY